MQTRIERDSLGEMQVPADALYGVQTARAIVNFPISGLRPHPLFVWATVAIKKAAASVNKELGELKPEVADAIVRAASSASSGLCAATKRDAFCGRKASLAERRINGATGDNPY